MIALTVSNIEGVVILLVSAAISLVMLAVIGVRTDRRERADRERRDREWSRAHRIEVPR